MRRCWRRARRYRRTEWQTPDGDFIELDWVDGPQDAPLVVLFHGLEGSSAQSLRREPHALRATRSGWRGVVPAFPRLRRTARTGCARAYHSGDYQEIDWMLERMAEDNAGRLASPLAFRSAAMLC